MEKGKLYYFHGDFEYGKGCIGKFSGIDETTGFVEFTDITYAEDLRDDYNMKSKIAQDLNGGESSNCIGAHGTEARAILDKFKKDGKKLPDALLRHNASTYNLRFIHKITLMKNYFVEA